MMILIAPNRTTVHFIRHKADLSIIQSIANSVLIDNIHSLHIVLGSILDIVAQPEVVHYRFIRSEIKKVDPIIIGNCYHVFIQLFAFGNLTIHLELSLLGPVVFFKIIQNQSIIASQGNLLATLKVLNGQYDFILIDTELFFEHERVGVIHDLTFFSIPEFDHIVHAQSSKAESISPVSIFKHIEYILFMHFQRYLIGRVLISQLIYVKKTHISGVRPDKHILIINQKTIRTLFDLFIQDLQLIFNTIDLYLADRSVLMASLRSSAYKLSFIELAYPFNSCIFLRIVIFNHCIHFGSVDRLQVHIFSDNNLGVQLYLILFEQLLNGIF